MADTTETMLSAFVEKGVIKTGRFTLKSGAASPLSVAMRQVAGHPLLFQRCVEAMAARVAKAGAICGVPLGAVPYATAVAARLGLPLTLLRKAPKAHGMGRQVDGHAAPTTRLALLDDVMTSGASVAAAVRTLHDHDMVVTQIVVQIGRAHV